MSVVQVRNGKLFKGVKYFINDSIGKERRYELESLLTDNGAEPAPSSNVDDEDLNIDGDSRRLARFDLAECTHVVTDSNHFPEVSLVQQWNSEHQDDKSKIFCTTPSWVIRSATIGIQDPHHYSPDPVKIFSGVFLQCSADLPKGDREALYGLVTALGGQQREAITKDTTHIACLSKHEATYDLIKETGLGIKFILPHWFDACITMQQKVDDEPFLFTTSLPPMLKPETWGSEVLYEKHQASRLKRTLIGVTIPGDEKKALFDSVNKADDGAEIEADREAVESVLVFEGKRVLLAAQLGLSKTLKKSLETWIRLAGGTVVEEDKELLACDIFITPYRGGVPFLLAIKHNKLVATLSWFYHVLKVGKLTSPMDQLLHYPVPSTPIPEFSDYEISVTNYTGEAREYLKRLIGAMGARFTTTLSSNNTHLVAASKQGDKVARCRTWHIPCINHKWLEACFQDWRTADLSRNEYSAFPPGINFMTLLGETGLTEEMVRKWTGKAKDLGEVDLETMLTQGEAAELGDVEEDVLEEAGDEKMDDVDGENKVEKRKDVGEGPSKRRRVSKSASASVQAQAGAPEPEAAPERDTTPKPKSRKSKAATAAAPPPQTTPLVATARLGNTTETPVSTKRSAATAAAQRLHDTIAPDMLQWEKEKKLKPNSKRFRADEVGFDAEAPKGRSKSPEKVRAATEDTTAGVKRAKKKATTPAAAAEEVKDEKPEMSLSLCGGRARILVTSVLLTAKEKAVISIYNVTMTESASDCTHVVTDAIKRTEKYLIAMANAPLIVDRSWLSDSAAAGHLLEETNYFLQDKAVEQQYDFKLSEALERAKKNEKKLFNGMTFFRTPHVETDLKILKRIVEAHGGEVVVYSLRSFESCSTNEKYVISHVDDAKLWPPIRKLGQEIYSREAILVAILKMKCEFDQHRLPNP